MGSLPGGFARARLSFIRSGPLQGACEKVGQGDPANTGRPELLGEAGLLHGHPKAQAGRSREGISLHVIHVEGEAFEVEASADLGVGLVAPSVYSVECVQEGLGVGQGSSPRHSFVERLARGRLRPIIRAKGRKSSPGSWRVGRLSSRRYPLATSILGASSLGGQGGPGSAGSMDDFVRIFCRRRGFRGGSRQHVAVLLPHSRERRCRVRRPLPGFHSPDRPSRDAGRTHRGPRSRVISLRSG